MAGCCGSGSDRALCCCERAQHGMVTLALRRLRATGRIRFVLIGMGYRLCANFGDEGATTRHCVGSAVHGA